MISRVTQSSSALKFAKAAIGCTTNSITVVIWFTYLLSSTLMRESKLPVHLTSVDHPQIPFRGSSYAEGSLTNSAAVGTAREGLLSFKDDLSSVRLATESHPTLFA